jgi:lipoprotein-anchoring transpeptidase ErfK/SrfK
VAFNPTYHFDAARLPTFNKATTPKLTIAAGPNSPVGTVWIDLTIDTYGIHGAPEAQLVGKVASHGCVRLTNWDATELAHAVKKGVPVRFVEPARADAAAMAKPG